MVEPLTPAEIQSINTALTGLPKGKLRYKRAQREEFFRLRGTDLSNEDIAALKEQFESDETGIDASQRDETALLQEVQVDFRKFLKELSLLGFRYKGRPLSEAIGTGDEFSFDRAQFTRGSSARSKVKVDKAFMDKKLAKLRKVLMNPLIDEEFKKKYEESIDLLVSVLPRMRARDISRVKITTARVPFETFFSAKSRLNASNRKKMYSDFANIEKAFNDLPDKLKEVAEEVKSDERLSEIVSSMQDLIKNNKLNYFRDFPEVDISVANVFEMEDRIAALLVENLLATQETLQTFDEGDEDSLEELKDKVEGPEETEEVSGDETKVDDNLLTAAEEYVEDIFDDGEYEEELETKLSLDPLSLIVLENVGYQMVFYAKSKGLSETKEEIKENIVQEIVIPFLKGVDKASASVALNRIEAQLDFLMGKLAKLEESVQGSVRLPVYFSELGSLRRHYPNIREDTSLNQNIDEFLNLYLELAFEEAPRGSVRTRRGGGGDKGEKDQYGIQVQTRGGDVRTYTERAARDIKPVLTSIEGKRRKGASIDELGELLTKLFIEVEDLSSGIAVNYPFTGSLIALRSSGTYSGQLTQRMRKTAGAVIKRSRVKQMNAFLRKFKGVGQQLTYETMQPLAEGFASALKSTYGAKRKSQMAKEIERDVASLVGALFSSSDFSNKQALRLFGRSIFETYREEGVDHPNEIRALTTLIKAIQRDPNAFLPKSEDQKEFRDLVDLVESFNLIIKEEINSKLLSAHDELRILKKSEVYRSYLNYDHIGDICKMQDHLQESNLDLTALEIKNIVKAVDSHKSIGNEYGISSDTVYLIKSHFR
jgi:hypothetical protein